MSDGLSQDLEGLSQGDDGGGDDGNRTPRKDVWADSQEPTSSVEAEAGKNGESAVGLNGSSGSDSLALRLEDSQMTQAAAIAESEADMFADNEKPVLGSTPTGSTTEPEKFLDDSVIEVPRNEKSETILVVDDDDEEEKDESSILLTKNDEDDTDKKCNNSIIEISDNEDKQRNIIITPPQPETKDSLGAGLSLVEEMEENRNLFTKSEDVPIAKMADSSSSTQSDTECVVGGGQGEVESTKTQKEKNLTNLPYSPIICEQPKRPHSSTENSSHEEDKERKTSTPDDEETTPFRHQRKKAKFVSPRKFVLQKTEKKGEFRNIPNLPNVSFSSDEERDDEAAAKEPKEKPDHELFKTPINTTNESEDTTYFIEVGSLSVLQRLRSEDILNLYKASSKFEKTNLEWEELDKTAEISKLKNKRLSNGSSLSTTSSKTTSTGSSVYFADRSSSSEGSKRDRTSIMPEARIQRHYVPSKLPLGHEKKLSQEAMTESESPPIQEEAIAVEVIPEDETLEDDNKQVIPVKKKRTSSKKPSSTASSGSPLKSQAFDKIPDLKIPTDPQELNEWLSKGKHKICPNVKVFAKWGEGKYSKLVNYYPAVVLEEATDDKGWKIQFEADGVERILRMEDLIPVLSLEPGHPINVTLKPDEGIYTSAILLSHPIPSEFGGAEYSVEFEKIENLPQVESSLVNYIDTHLSADQADAIKKDLGGFWCTQSVCAVGSELTLSNIVSGKRRTRSSISVTPKSLSRKSKKTPRTRKHGGDNVDTSAQESTAESSEGKKKAKKLFDEVSTTTDDEAKPKKRGSRKSSKQTDTSDGDGGGGKLLFQGMSFVLTQSRRAPHNDDDFVSIDEETESETEKEEGTKMEEPVFDRKEIQQLIISNGGVVLEEINSPFAPDIILISDRYSRTMNYLMALTYGCRRIHFFWIRDSCREKKKLAMNNYLLPVGWSEVEKAEIEDFPRGSAGKFLSKIHVLLTASSSHFCEDWRLLMIRLGADVSFRSQGKIDRNLESVSVVVADEKTAPASVLESARKRQKPIVSTKWVIESLIKGEKLPFKDFIVETN